MKAYNVNVVCILMTQTLNYKYVSFIENAFVSYIYNAANAYTNWKIKMIIILFQMQNIKNIAYHNTYWYDWNSD